MKRNRKSPDLLIVGAHKAGTTYLHSLLDLHPQVEMSKPKEPHFLVRQSCGPRLHTGVFEAEEYFSLWSRPHGETITGEASVLYLPFAREAIANISRDFDNTPRIVICLRDPIQRALSAFRDESLKNPRESAAKFSDAVVRELEAGPKDTGGSDSPAMRYLALSHYADGIKAFQRAFGAEGVHVVESRDLFETPESVMHQLHLFLDLPPSNCWKRVGAQNVGQVQWSSSIVTSVMKAAPVVKGRRALKRFLPPVHSVARKASMSGLTKPAAPMSASLNTRLARLFRDDVEEVRTLVGRDLNHWLVD